MKTEIKIPKGWRRIRSNEKPDMKRGDKCLADDGQWFETNRVGITRVNEGVPGLVYIRRKKGSKC